MSQRFERLSAVLLLQMLCFVVASGQLTFVDIPTATDDYLLSYALVNYDVVFNVTAKGKGYVGFGFSNSTGMTGADIFIGGVLDSGEPYFGVRSFSKTYCTVLRVSCT